MRTPLVVVTGVDPVAMDATLVGLAWDLPRAVVVRQRIDPWTQVLSRVVSDATGVVERADLTLEHACVSCALREDVLPTLERLARDGRWDSIVACLPTGTEAFQLSAVLARDARLARRLRISSVVTTVAAETLEDDLLSSDLLRERDRHMSPDDDRGVGEVGCAQVELADVVLLTADPGERGSALVHALARPDARVVTGADDVGGDELVAHRHRHRHAAAWGSPVLEGELPGLPDGSAGEVWRLDLCSARAFHPERLVEEIERLGAGQFRTRGCFWVPTRPGSVQQWAGAGGQLSIGDHGLWGRRAPRTRLIVTGTGEPPPDLHRAFAEVVLTEDEARRDLGRWRQLEDGLEPWLGDIRDVA